MINKDEMILKELDKQRIKSNMIAIIMKKLNNDELKDKFLISLIENRNNLLSFFEINNILNQL